MNFEKKPIAKPLDNYEEYLPAIDVSDGIRRVMNNKKMYFKLLTRFDVRKMVNELITNMQKGDFALIKETAHTLKGVAANLSFTELYSLSLAIEDKAKLGQECSELIAPIDKAADNVIQSIGKLLKREGI